MMGKVNIDKVKNFDPVRAERQSGVKSTETPPIRPERAASSGEKDRVNFSGKAAEVGKLVNQVKDLPEVRAEKVAEAKAEIQAGKFHPKAVDIAEGIVNDEMS